MLFRSAAREAAKGKGKIGTTGRGIGPCYEDKTARRGIRLVDLTSDDLDVRIDENLKYVNFMLVEFLGAEAVKKEDVVEALDLARERLLPLAADVPMIFHGGLTDIHSGYPDCLPFSGGVFFGCSPLSIPPGGP